MHKFLISLADAILRMIETTCDKDLFDKKKSAGKWKYSILQAIRWQFADEAIWYLVNKAV